MSDALKEGHRRVAQMREVVGISDDIAAWYPLGFEMGAEWQRDHIAAQEPTDVEVLAALNAFHRYPGGRNYYGLSHPQADSMRAALTAAKEARA